MHRFATLRLIMRFGAIGCPALALVVGMGLGILLWGSLGWLALPLAVLAGGFAYLLARSYVEIITIVMEMAH